MSHAGDVALISMRVMAGWMREAGIAGVCISPGSRSTPLALAFEDLPRAFVHLDERSAAFFALGMAKAAGLPAVCICTSGTAAANFLPAVIEASQARVPLIVLTADRPPELRGTGSNQTIDQVRLYGGYTRLFVDADVPEPDAERSWRDLAARAWQAAQLPTPGPVHLNVPFREPLAPSGFGLLTARIDFAPVEPAVEQLASSLDDDLQALIDAARTPRGAIVAGGIAWQRGDPVERVADLARALGWPLIAEPTSGLRLPGRALAAGQALLGDLGFAGAHVPDVVLQVGTTPTTRASLAFVARARRLITVDPDGWPQDPAGRADRVVRAAPGGLADALLRRIEPRTDAGWLEEWRAADDVARAELDGFLDDVAEPFEPRVARDLAADLRAGSTLFVGNSTPVRDLDLAMRPREGLRVLANRGASGIDGLVSTALGVGAAAGNAAALLGDLGLLHDVGSLLWSARRGIDARFVIVNNDGGGIFDLVPDAPYPGHERLFVTPHGLDLAEVAAAAGAHHARVERLGVHGGRGPTRTQTVRIEEVRIDRHRAVTLRAGLKAAVARALAG